MSWNAQIPEISAEMLLNYFYPELQDQWVARHEGTFYRNYNQDVLSLEPEEATVSLSRDNFLALLPQGLLAREDDLKTGDKLEKHKQQEEEVKLLSEAFLPFDCFAFRQRLHIERQVSDLLETKLSYLLKTFFGLDLDTLTNPYVRELAVILPYVRQWRGDFNRVKNLLSSLFQCEVRLIEKRFSHTDSHLKWIPLVRYELLVPNLSPEAYRSLQANALAVEAFLSEWFIPMEMRLEVRVKQHGACRKTDEELTLDYNTEL